MQSEYSLWTRDPETGVLDALRDLGVALVPYSPLGRGCRVDVALTAAELAVLDPLAAQVAGARY